MRSRERRETGQNDLFKARLDQIVDVNHALVKLERSIDWRFLEQSFGAVYHDGPGRPPLATRLMAGLAILKHRHASPTRRSAIAGSRTRITSSSVAKSSSSTSFPSTAPR